MWGDRRDRRGAITRVRGPGWVGAGAESCAAPRADRHRGARTPRLAPGARAGRADPDLPGERSAATLLAWTKGRRRARPRPRSGKLATDRPHRLEVAGRHRRLPHHRRTRASARCHFPSEMGAPLDGRRLTRAARDAPGPDRRHRELQLRGGGVRSGAVRLVLAARRIRLGLRHAIVVQRRPGSVGHGAPAPRPANLRPRRRGGLPHGRRVARDRAGGGNGALPEPLRVRRVPRLG